MGLVCFGQLSEARSVPWSTTQCTHLLLALLGGAGGGGQEGRGEEERRGGREDMEEDRRVWEGKKGQQRGEDRGVDLTVVIPCSGVMLCAVEQQCCRVI